MDQPEGAANEQQPTEAEAGSEEQPVTTEPVYEPEPEKDAEASNVLEDDPEPNQDNAETEHDIQEHAVEASPPEPTAGASENEEKEKPAEKAEKAPRRMMFADAGDEEEDDKPSTKLRLRKQTGAPTKNRGPMFADMGDDDEEDEDEEKPNSARMRLRQQTGWKPQLAASANSVASSKSMGSTKSSTTSIGGKSGKLTFSSAPHVHKARPHEREDFSHNRFEVMKIGYENEVLVHKLTEIGTKPSLEAHVNRNPTVSPAGKPLPCYVAHSSVNRRKEADAIAQQNLQLYKRLQAIKPSKDISREQLAKSHKQNQAYAQNCAVYKVNSTGGM